MAWIPIAAWGVAAVVALVVLGYCAYEISWKTKRLRRDMDELTKVNAQLTQLRGELTETLTETQRRLAASGLG
ncbi:hypothetical protein SAMN05443575_2829 [Jatrophihabitans endophyticus]|uniref:Uncharacterized protein n=1 Tax=Jatrophihabitans endophyticus TaxID=1206085 RepID=A0A1M5MTX5_9ACTN|nr:hypothetical protein [Jatrophihabitans endophyticus]SHG80820.1 hypothetical protein SAMN05443575_2829 [Jatrophihabitans endophyticus]